MYEWFKQCHGEGILIFGPILCKKVSLMKSWKLVNLLSLQLDGCKNFKLWHGIHCLKASSGKMSTVKGVTEKFVDIFSKLSERWKKEKPNFMKQVTLQEMFRRLWCLVHAVA